MIKVTLYDPNHNDRRILDTLISKILWFGPFLLVILVYTDLNQMQSLLSLAETKLSAKKVLTAVQFAGFVERQY